MRRDIRKKLNQDDLNMKIIKYSAIGVAVLTIIVLALLMYSKSLNDEAKEGTLTSEQIATIINNTGNTESASTEIGKSVEEAENTINETTNNTIDNTVENIAETNTTNNTQTTNPTLTTSNVKTKEETSNENTTPQNTTTENQTVELNFEKPVDGEIVRDFAMENLIYSETLQEWTTHTGIDIKADKTTVVKAAEAGTVKSIKNDPRYGLTIVVEHEGGFQTVYSNLLTSEFVVEGEKVEKGQSLGTVGNTAAFEIADEPHLHFEVLKDSVQVDPNIYIK